jgi:hypothetical protein
MSDREDRIREIAYFLWLDEGCPEGHSERHWRDAEMVVDIEPAERKRTEGEPPGEPALHAAPASSATPASTAPGGASSRKSSK